MALLAAEVRGCSDRLGPCRQNTCLFTTREGGSEALLTAFSLILSPPFAQRPRNSQRPTSARKMARAPTVLLLRISENGSFRAMVHVASPRYTRRLCQPQWSGHDSSFTGMSFLRPAAAPVPLRRRSRIRSSCGHDRGPGSLAANGVIPAGALSAARPHDGRSHASHVGLFHTCFELSWKSSQFQIHDSQVKEIRS